MSKYNLSDGCTHSNREARNVGSQRYTKCKTCGTILEIRGQL